MVKDISSNMWWSIIHEQRKYTEVEVIISINFGSNSRSKEKPQPLTGKITSEKKIVNSNFHKYTILQCSCSLREFNNLPSPYSWEKLWQSMMTKSLSVCLPLRTCLAFGLSWTIISNCNYYSLGTMIILNTTFWVRTTTIFDNKVEELVQSK